MSSALASLSPPRARLSGLAWGGLGILAFSVSLPATRLAVVGGLDPWFIGMGRAVVAGILATMTLAASGAVWPPRALLGRLVLVALGVVVGFPVLTAIALKHVPAAHSVVVVGLLPAATAVMAVLRAGERPSALFWLAALVGLALVVGFAVAQGGGRPGPADGLLLAAVALCALGYAEGAVLARGHGGVRVICWALLLSLPLTIALTLLHADPVQLGDASAAAWAGFAYLSAISMFAGFFAWYRGLALGGVARVGQVQLMQPLLSLLWAALLLGERVTPLMLLTCAGVLGCVVVTQRAR